MEIRPLYETQTIKMINPTLPGVQTLEKAKNKLDQYGNIPNGIAKVLHWEKIRQLFTIAISGALFIWMTILILLYAYVFDSSWFAFIIPTAIALASSYKLIMTLYERKYLLNSIKRYSEDLKAGISSTPGFIAKMYRALIQKQVRHNWFTFTVMFYGGIITLLLWWLKDTSWWIFDFEGWIHSWFSNPDLMTILFAIALLATIILHMVFAVQRKRRMLEIDSYFGSQVLPQTDIDSLKVTENKMLRRLFIISLMVLLIIPLAVKIIKKIVRKK